MHNHYVCCAIVQADLLYLPFVERFALALALPSLTSSDLANACQGVMSPWLEAMRQLECCKQACPDHKLFQQALRCLPSSSVPQDHYRQNSVWSSAIADSCALQA